MRRFAIILILLLAAAGAFSGDLGLGVSGGYVLNETSTSLASPAVSSETRFTHVPFGAWVYGDAGIFLVSFGYTQFTFSHQLWTQTVLGTTTTIVDAGTGTGGYLAYALYGKYPFALGALTLSPLFGFEVDLNVLLLDAGGNDLRLGMNDAQKAGQNQLWIKAGAALDYALTERAYVRSEILVGYKLRSFGEQQAYLAATHAGFDVVLFSMRSDLSMMVGLKF